MNITKDTTLGDLNDRLTLGDLKGIRLSVTLGVTSAGFEAYARDASVYGVAQGDDLAAVLGAAIAACLAKRATPTERVTIAQPGPFDASGLDAELTVRDRFGNVKPRPPVCSCPRSSGDVVIVDGSCPVHNAATVKLDS